MPDAPVPSSMPSLPDARAVSRRDWLQGVGVLLAGLAATPVLPAPLAGQPRATQPKATQPKATQPKSMTVYKSPTCGCCTAWVEHVQKAGYRVTVRDLPELTEMKAAFGVPRALESCHTAQVGGYLVEGHVPADLIDRLLAEKPDARGLAVPGMPIGSPGMEGGTPERYQVLLFDKAGQTRVYATR
jgi:hypothetical protein